MQPIDFIELGYSGEEALMLADAHSAITKADLWEYFTMPSTPGKDGFMFSTDQELVHLQKFIKYDGHSGASYGMTMRVMELIAKLGWEGFCSKSRKNRAPCHCRKEKGFTSGWCGVAGGGVPGCDH